MKLRYCVRCVMPHTRPDLHIDDDGVCNACRSYERRMAVDWEARRTELFEITDRYRSRSTWDCVAPMSGAVDFRPREGGEGDAYSRCGQLSTGRDLVEWEVELEQLDTREILITAIARDRMMTGYDVDAVAAVSSEVGIPAIAAGGAGSYEDMRRVITEAGASAAAAHSICPFTQATPLEAKAHQGASGIPACKHLTN